MTIFAAKNFDDVENFAKKMFHHAVFVAFTHFTSECKTKNFTTMKQTSFLLFTICMLLCGATSCNDSVLSDDDTIIIDPVDYPMFQFDENGIPYRYEHPTLSADMQQSLKTDFVGYGWKWMQTNEIEDSGYVKHQGFYENILGVGPISYYLESDSTIECYYHSDVNNRDGFIDHRYTLDAESGILSNYTKPFGRDGGDLYMRIWSIYQLSGHWYMACVEPLCTRYNEIGLPHTVWGVSQYVRMSEADLHEMQDQYNNYFGIQHCN